MQGNQRQTDWAYVAGVMDSDGCFMITRQNRVFNGINRPHYTPIVKISQIQEEAIKFITKDLNLGSYKLERVRHRLYPNGVKVNCKPMYMWFIRNKEEIKEFLLGVYPYLRIKQPRAEVLLDFCKPLRSKEYGWYKPIPQNELDRREELYIKIRELNGHKVAATTKS